MWEGKGGRDSTTRQGHVVPYSSRGREEGEEEAKAEEVSQSARDRDTDVEARDAERSHYQAD